jgi:MFS family permease
MASETTANMAVIDTPFDKEKMGSSDKEDLPPVEAKFSRRGLPLIPQPSDDPFDPLNWSSIRKVLVLAVMCIWAIIGPLNMISVASAFFPISKELNISLTEATYLVGAPLLSYGVASLIWVALGNRFGVRLIFVLTSLIAGLFCIWGAKATNAASLIAARTLTSIFSASPETLGPQAIADVFFLHDRAKCIGLFTLFQASGFAMGSLIGGYITVDLGWRWIQWIVAILSISTSVLLFLVFPETQYTRDSENLHHRQRNFLDSFRFWPVSGGGRRKVDRYAVASPKFEALLIFSRLAWVERSSSLSSTCRIRQW